jgi:hypothetical protein
MKVVTKVSELPKDTPMPIMKAWIGTEKDATPILDSESRVLGC